MLDLEPEVTKTSASGIRTKRVMALALEEQEQPSRVTRQRTRDLLSDREDTTDPQDGFTEDVLIASNATNNQNELSTEGKCLKSLSIIINLHISIFWEQFYIFPLMDFQIP
jgi:hypothetical protein